MTTPVKPDSLFQICITNYPDAFGIEDIETLKIQKRSIVPESVYIDAVITFTVDFDFKKLDDRIFPFLGKENIVEYKGNRDDLSLKKFCQYAMTELGLIACDFLSKKGEEGTEDASLSQKAATNQWQRLKAQGAKHSCTTVIVSTGDPKGLRKAFGFELVDTYDHLSGSLYCLDMFNNKLVGSMAIYIVVINDLPVHSKNAPLLLLSTGTKQEEFLEWLLETHDGLTIQRRSSYLRYLAKYDLVEDWRIIEEMSKKTNRRRDNTLILMEILADTLRDGESSEKEIADTFQHFSSLVWPTDSPVEAAQRMMQVDSPVEAAQRMMQVDSPMEMAQVALQADSPAEAAFSLIHSEEEKNRLLEMLHQSNIEHSES